MDYSDDFPRKSDSMLRSTILGGLFGFFKCHLTVLQGLPHLFVVCANHVVDADDLFVVHGQQINKQFCYVRTVQFLADVDPLGDDNLARTKNEVGAWVDFVLTVRIAPSTMYSMCSTDAA